MARAGPRMTVSCAHGADKHHDERSRLRDVRRSNCGVTAHRVVSGFVAKALMEYDTPPWSD
jgi:hypothetical protein